MSVSVIVFVCNYSRGPKVFSATGRYMGKSECFDRNCEKCANETNNVDDLTERGSRCSTTKSENKAILAMFWRNLARSL